MTRVCIFHNAVTPYRLPLFDALAADVELTVLFGRETEADRRWPASLDGVGFAHRVLPGFDLGPLVINPTLPAALRVARPEVVLHADSDENLLSLALVVGLRRLYGYRLLVWVEQVPRTAAALATTRAARRRLGWPLTRAALALMTGLRRWAYRAADGLVSMSGPASDAFIAELDPRGTPVYTGTQVMPAECLAPAPARVAEHRAEGPLRLLFIGYLRANKNVAALIGAFAGLPAGSAELVIAGSGPELGRLAAAAAGVAGVRFVGHLDGSEKAECYRASDLVVVPSFLEPWGMVVNEALFYGVPVLVSRSVAASVLIDEETDGLIFDADLDGDLARVLGRYVADPQLRSRLAAGAGAADRARVSDVEVGTRAWRAALAGVGGERA